MAPNDSDFTTNKPDDLPSALAEFEAKTGKRLDVPPRAERRKAGEVNSPARLEAPPPPASPFAHKLVQGKVDIAALEQDQAERKARDRGEDGDVKLGRDQPGPSREMVPILAGHHDARGRDFSKITGGTEKKGQTVQEQGRAHHERVAAALKKTASATGIRPVEERERPPLPKVVLPYDPGAVPQGLRKSALYRERQARLF